MSERQHSRRAMARCAAGSRIALLPSAGLDLKATKDSFDVTPGQIELAWGGLDVFSPVRLRSEWKDTPRLAVARGGRP
jgi:hypothetical protein